MNPHQSATALLATVRHTLSGREIEICEGVIERADPDDELIDPFLILGDGGSEGYDYCPNCNKCDVGNDDGDCTECGKEVEDVEDDEGDVYLTEDAATFRSLEIQFYREITAWIDAQDRVISAATLRDHPALIAA